ncbi:hypothetical protein [Denitromonas halophila]|uniref:Uncharacterized protein n=1 Tax=Denitromonas halophila TaxID=1629404 RepID=A0A557R117_9RHOO|nr:hypothetical protein [Denitromonas halophila]TVO58840.1 hypothetical protein FHP91_04035 [Denitromonas halophila]
MRQLAASSYLKIRLLLLLPLLGLLGACAQMPAALPMKEAVERNTVTSVDGEWRISTLGKRIRIEAGRAYAVDPWLHLGVMQIQPGMVVWQNVRRTAPAQFAGDDLPLQGAFSASLNTSGQMDVAVQGALGPVRYQLIPVDIDNRTAYEAEMRMAGPPVPPVGIVPPIPMPDPTPAPPPPVRNDVTPGCGGFGETPCSKIQPVAKGKAKKLGCPGRQSYFSSVRGGSCWVCPDGYKRTAHKLDHPKACRQRGKLIGGPYKRAVYQKQASGCASGQFNVLGTCMSCPAGYERDGVGAVSSNRCKPLRGNFGCDGNLRPAKQPPKLKTMLSSLFGTKSGKACAPAFDIRAAARQNLPRSNQLKNAAKEFLDGMFSSKQTRKAYRNALIRRDWKAATEILIGQQNFIRVVKLARSLGYREVTVGAGGDVAVLGGINGELGLVVNTGTGRLRPYASGGLSKGAAVGVDGSVVIGFWKLPYETGHTQGVVGSISGVVSVGGGAWYTYFDPGTRAQERLAGFTFSAGVGLGAEYGEYNEVGTKVWDQVGVTVPVL